ncbi:MAG: hypothetical protein AAGF67_01290 [Verrucomicrobiota bacterium]
MINQIRVALLLLLAFGLCLSPAVASTRVCVVSLDTCCDVKVETCETEGHGCDEEQHDCCLTVLSDETLAKVPEGLSSFALECVPAHYFDVAVRAVDAQTLIRSVIPDPPPSSMSDRLARLELFLI